jgi:hypothetical protein
MKLGPERQSCIISFLVLQGRLRCHIQRHRYRRLRRAVVVIQSCARRVYSFVVSQELLGTVIKVEQLELERIGKTCEAISNQIYRGQVMKIILDLLVFKQFYFSK